MPGYEAVIPPHLDPAAIAYHFIGTYASGAFERPDLISQLKTDVNHWMSLWRNDDNPLPALAITPLFDDHYMLFDSRGLDETEEIQFVDREQASVVLTGGVSTNRTTTWSGPSTRERSSPWTVDMCPSRRPHPSCCASSRPSAVSRSSCPRRIDGRPGRPPA